MEKQSIDSFELSWNYHGKNINDLPGLSTLSQVQVQSQTALLEGHVQADLFWAPKHQIIPDS